MSTSDPKPSVDQALAEIRRSDYRATGLLVIGVGVAVALIGSGWSWPFFLWGPVAAGGAVLLTRMVLRLGYRMTSATSDEVARAKARSWQRFRFVYLTTLLVGASCGALAARLESALPDIAFTVLVLLGPITGLMALPRVRRMSD